MAGLWLVYLRAQAAIVLRGKVIWRPASLVQFPNPIPARTETLRTHTHARIHTASSPDYQ